MTKTKQIAHTYREEHRGLVPTFITTCECGQENKWMTTGVMIPGVVCKNCGEFNVIVWDAIEVEK